MSQSHISASAPSLSPYQQEQAVTLIRSVRERLLADDPDIAADPDLWRDTLDGESDAIDLIRNLIRASIDADITAGLHASAVMRSPRGPNAQSAASKPFAPLPLL
jgi:hypothetical protein